MCCLQIWLCLFTFRFNTLKHLKSLTLKFLLSVDSVCVIQELSTLLSKVKGTGQVSLNQPSQRTSIQQESDMVLRPLMDLLDGR